MVALHQKFMKHKTNCIPHLDQRWGFFAIKIPCYQMIARNLLFSYALARGVTCVPVFYPTLFPISTHAPARGDDLNKMFPIMIDKFQLTHPQGVRQGIIRGLRNYDVFQLTHPRGVRPIHGSRSVPLQDISTHAPARGATGHIVPELFASRYFNSRTREGCDCSADSFALLDAYFNSRTREGCDLYSSVQSRVIRIFQLTHPRGVRRQKHTKSLTGSCLFF